MKRCIEEHRTRRFGLITVGALFEDDSEFITEPDKFEDVDDSKPAPRKRASHRSGEED